MTVNNLRSAVRPIVTLTTVITTALLVGYEVIARQAPISDQWWVFLALVGGFWFGSRKEG